MTLLACASASGHGAEWKPVEDTAMVLHNPDMGWVFYEFGRAIDNGYDYPEVDYVAIAVYWRGVEPREGQYDFSRVDRLYDHWRGKGKRAMLRLFAEDIGTQCPGYVLDRMAPEEKARRSALGHVDYLTPDARNPYYQERLGSFLRAVAAHYSDSAGRPVETVDLRGHGLWGEWHSGFPYPDTASRREALRKTLDTWSAGFPRHTLLLSYSHDPDSDRAVWSDSARYGDYLRWSAFDYAVTKRNISFRRDGAYGALKANERRFGEYAFSVLKRGPFMSEFAQGYVAGKAAEAVKDALSLHPNFICLFGYSKRDFFENDRAVFDWGLRNMGYRLVPVSGTYPDSVAAGSAFTFTTRWVNRAVGRSLADFTLRVRLRDAAGKTAATVDLGPTGSSAWVRGGNHAVAGTVSFGGIPAGGYRLSLALLDPRTGKPIAMPLPHRESDGYYPVGPIKVGPARPSGLRYEREAPAAAAEAPARLRGGLKAFPASSGTPVEAGAGGPAREARGRWLRSE